MLNEQFQKMIDAYMQSNNSLDTCEKMIMMYLRTKEIENGIAEVRIPDIGSACEVADATIKRKIATLMDKGFLRKDRKGTRYAKSIYVTLKNETNKGEW